MSVHEIEITLNADNMYDIEKVAVFTGYSSGHLRNLEREGKIPKSMRDNHGWRVWRGQDVLTIIKYKKEHKSGICL